MKADYKYRHRREHRQMDCFGCAQWPGPSERKGESAPSLIRPCHRISLQWSPSDGSQERHCVGVALSWSRSGGLWSHTPRSRGILRQWKPLRGVDAKKTKGGVVHLVGGNLQGHLSVGTLKFQTRDKKTMEVGPPLSLELLINHTLERTCIPRYLREVFPTEIDNKVSSNQGIQIVGWTIFRIM